MYVSLFFLVFYTNHLLVNWNLHFYQTKSIICLLHIPAMRIGLVKSTAGSPSTQTANTQTCKTHNSDSKSLDRARNLKLNTCTLIGPRLLFITFGTYFNIAKTTCFSGFREHTNFRPTLFIIIIISNVFSPYSFSQLPPRHPIAGLMHLFCNYIFVPVLRFIFTFNGINGHRFFVGGWDLDSLFLSQIM